MGIRNYHKDADSGNLGRIQAIAWDKLSFEDLKVKDTSGETLLHKMAKSNLLGLVPKKFLCHELLACQTYKRRSVYLYAASYGGAIEDIEPHLLTRDVLLEPSERGETVLMRLIGAEKINLVDSKLIDEGILLEKCPLLGAPYIHLCAKTEGALAYLPEKCYKPYLGLPDGMGNTMLHWMADGDQLENYPVSQETMDLIKVKNNSDETPLHRVKNLSALPKEYLTLENLSSLDKNKSTPLHKSVWKYGTELLPIKCLTPELLLMENTGGDSVLSLLTLVYQEERDYENLRKLFRILPTEGLKSLERLGWQGGARRLLEDAIKTKVIQKVSGSEIALEL